MSGSSPHLSIDRPSVSMAAARALCTAASRLAGEQGIAVVIAVVDCEGGPKAFERMDGAGLLAAEMAGRKAWTAVARGRTTHSLGEAIAANPAMAELTRLPRVSALGGGYPILDGELVIGGLGVSGGSQEQDMAIAEGALRELAGG